MKEIRFPFWTCVRSIGVYRQIQNNGEIIDITLGWEENNEVAIEYEISPARREVQINNLLDGISEICDEEEFIEAYLKAKEMLDQKFINSMTNDNLKRKLNL